MVHISRILSGYASFYDTYIQVSLQFGRTEKKEKYESKNFIHFTYNLQ